jgi:hypothetical protein
MTTREALTIVIEPSLWRGFDVVVEPPLSRHALQHRRTYGEALAYAQQLSLIEGWPLRDRTGENGTKPPRAA